MNQSIAKSQSEEAGGDSSCVRPTRGRRNCHTQTWEDGSRPRALRYWSDTELRNDPDRIRSDVQAVSNTDESERSLRDLLTSGVCQNMSDARQAIMHEREHHHPDLHEDQPVAAALGPAFVGFRYRFYTTTYQGNDALVAHIIDKIKHPSRSDCLKMVLDTFVAKMISTTPPAASRPGTTTANDIQDANGPCVAAVLAAYDEAVKTIGKTKTRLGLQADHVTCR